MNPLEGGLQGTPVKARETALDKLDQNGGQGIILAGGGGDSPGMPKRNIRAILQALAEREGSRLPA